MSAPEVIFLSGDLIFAGRVRAACESTEMRFTFAASLPKEVAGEVRWVILDLSTRSGLTGELAAEVRGRFPDAKVIAYAPHVHKSRIVAARNAGFDQVMTRSQFDSWLTTFGRE